MRNNPTKQATPLVVNGWEATEENGLAPKAGAKLELDLVFELESIADAEDATGVSLITGLTKQVVNTPKISLVRVMLWASARPLQPQFTLQDAKRLVTHRNWNEIWLAVLDAWAEGMKKPLEGEEIPQKA